jgi:hypothetical protein
MNIDFINVSDVITAVSFAREIELLRLPGKCTRLNP